LPRQKDSWIGKKLVGKNKSRRNAQV